MKNKSQKYQRKVRTGAKWIFIKTGSIVSLIVNI